MRAAGLLLCVCGAAACAHQQVPRVPTCNEYRVGLASSTTHRATARVAGSFPHAELVILVRSGVLPHQPVAHASIALHASSFGRASDSPLARSSTDSLGVAELQELAAGTYEVVVRRVEHDTERKVVLLRAGYRDTLDVLLAERRLCGA